MVIYIKPQFVREREKKSFNTLTINPFTLNGFTTRVSVCSRAMLLPVEPLPWILSSIWPAYLTKAMLLVVSVFPAIHFSAIRPSENSFTMHLIFSPFTCKSASICPRVGPYTFNIIVSELSFIFRIVWPDKKAVLSMFLPCDVRSLIEWAVWPGF